MKTENAPEKKKKRKAIIKISIVFLVLLLSNYLLLSYMGFYKSCLAMIIILLIDFIVLFNFGSDFVYIVFQSKSSMLLNEELEELEKLLDYNYHQEYNRQSSLVDEENEICPRCKNFNRDEIVDKIKRVKGKVSGNFHLGYGSIKGDIDTNPVNHCNLCGNEWIKTKLSITIGDAMNNLLDKMYDFFNEGKDNTSDPLKKFSAKAIKLFIKEKKSHGYKAEELSSLSIKDFRKYKCL